MTKEKTTLHKRLENGESLLIVEMSPPKGGDSEFVRAAAKGFADKAHALGVGDNRHGVAMSALAAASIVAQEGIEPILHITTRDRNRTALVSDCLGAAALGIRNVLCTTGTHQTLSPSRSAKNVFDIDSVQLIQALSNLKSAGALVGEAGLSGAGPYCIGGVAAPFADPLEMQILRLAKKVQAGAQFLITQPVFDLDRFETWWSEVQRLELHKKTAFIAGVQILTSADEARQCAESLPSPCVPSGVPERIASRNDAAAQRAAGIEIAVETVERLKQLDGLRGFEIRCEGENDAALEVIAKTKLGIA
ncbi:methylenetetrahydrofolate reductase [Candidatus Sumerlaeota bacterium]|nr:methylenetetrahydrofolate reductase [Candidatus Sumerlaeota bacterium]